MSLLRSLRDEPSLRRPAALLAVLVPLVLLGELLLRVAVDDIREGASGFPAWLPPFGTIGETVLFYTTLLNVFEYVAVPAVLVWLAYAYGRYSVTEASDSVE